MEEKMIKYIDDHEAEMIELWKDIVRIESPSYHKEGVDKVAAVLEKFCTEKLGYHIRYLQDDVYTYSVIVPDFLSRSGQVRISKNADESTQHFVASIDKRGYEKYAFTVSMLCEEPDKYHLFIIDGSLNLNKWHYKHLSDSDKAQYQAELEKHKEEIKELVTAAKAIWPFIE